MVSFCIDTRYTIPDGRRKISVLLEAMNKQVAAKLVQWKIKVVPGSCSHTILCFSLYLMGE